MKKIEISDELYREILKFKEHADEPIEDVIARMLKLRAVPITRTVKLVFVGEAAVGKSSIREYFFDNKDPDLLEKGSLEPTRGIEYHTYEILDLQCSVVDTSGQEIGDWMQERAQEVFAEADFIILVTGAPEFSEKYSENYDLLKEIMKGAEASSKDAELVMFVHKMDLLSPLETVELQQLATREHEVFKVAEEKEIPLYYTSIVSPYDKWLNIAFTELLRIGNLLSTNYRDFLDTTS